MAKKDPPKAEDAGPQHVRHVSSDGDKAKARKWFAQANKLMDSRNYDYSIKSYIEGLHFWPEAIDEAHKPLRAVAQARQLTGGKKPGFLESRKYSMSDKDPVKAMLNAEWLWSHDPQNSSYVEGMVKNAVRANLPEVAMLAGPICMEILRNEAKPSAKKFNLLHDYFEELGDKAQAWGDLDLSASAYEYAIEALNYQKSIEPTNRDLDNVIRDLATKLTILKGRYKTAKDFKDSVRDSESQHEIHDQERLVQSDERIQELIAKAEAEIAANPGVTGKVMTLIDLLTRRDDAEDEKKAIQVLTDEFERTGDYRYKMRADDIRIKQLGRKTRQARDSSDRDAYKSARVKQLRFELPVFEERTKNYPTDLRIRYEFGMRLFTAGKFDEAIPVFQQARSDPKNRTRCLLYLGRCFFEKKYYSEAIETLDEGKNNHEIPDDAIAKDLLYWLGRSLGDSGKSEEAKKTFGQLLQLDYNYKDVRVRIEGLRDS